MGREGGITGGRDGNVHFGDRTKGCVGMVSMLPDMMLIATGLAMAFKMRGEQRVAMTWFGDGSTSRGDFHEAMNWAGVQRLPVIFILENNQYAYSTPVDQQFAVNPVERAAAYGFPGVEVDGNDVEAMFEVTREARERALAGEGPTLIEAVTMRMHGHAAHDDMKYVPKRAGRGVAGEGPDRPPGAPGRGARGRRRRPARGGQGGDRRRRRRRRSRAPMPDGETATDRVFADEPALLEDGNAPWSGFANEGGALMPTMTYLQAISDAMREEMRSDERVFVMGEDIGDVRRRLQGDRRLHRRVRPAARDGHAAGRVGDHRLRDRRGRARACGRSPRCSSPTSSPAASTSSSTSPGRCTTARACR